MKEATIAWTDNDSQTIRDVVRVEDVDHWLILTTEDGEQRWISVHNCYVVRISEQESSSDQP